MVHKLDDAACVWVCEGSICNLLLENKFSVPL